MGFVSLTMPIEVMVNRSWCLKKWEGRGLNFLCGCGKSSVRLLLMSVSPRARVPTYDTIQYVCGQDVDRFLKLGNFASTIHDRYSTFGVKM